MSASLFSNTRAIARTSSSSKRHTPELEVINCLSSTERQVLQQCEATIDASLKSFYQAGKSLKVVHDKKLYRESFRSFDDYCHRRWKFSRHYAYRLITASEVVEELMPLGDIETICHEAVVRPLAGLEKDLVKIAWRKANELANGKPPKAKHVKQAVAELLQPKSSSEGGSSPISTRKTSPTTDLGVYQRLAMEAIESLKADILRGDIEDAKVVMGRIRLALERIG